MESIIAVFLKAGKSRVLATSGVLVLLIAMADWSIGNRASLGVFYILPTMLGATVLGPLGTGALAILCALLRSWFDIPAPPLEAKLRFVFGFLAYAGSGLFVTALIRNRRLVIEHLGKIEREQQLRREAEQQLSVLVESSPAAILTTDGAGVVIAANHAADNLFTMPDGQTLRGRRIGNYLPVLADALRLGIGAEGFRTTAQCQGRRENSEIFLAQTWFSSYLAPEGMRLAAIVVDSSEEMRDREEQSLRQLMEGNRIAAAAVSHEVRNLCGAISMICSSMQEKHPLALDEDFQRLTSLAKGLERIASLDLLSRVSERLEDVDLREVLDNLRIVIEPDWRDVAGAVNWQLPDQMPIVVADPHGLLQAFMNLAQNSHRAVQESSLRELTVTVIVEEQKAIVRFADTGTGIAAPERLFEPFQPGAEGTGLGLYVSRAVVRSYGGELRYEPQNAGSCFAIELQVA
jgi:two-component system, LuxR family, sensor kinase FixL